MGEGRTTFKISTGKPTGKRSFGRSGYTWKENIRMDLKEMGIKYEELG